MFYSQLKKLCEKNNTTPTAIVKKLGYSTSKVTAWKKGSIPNLLIANKIADYFGVSTDYLLGNENVSETDTNKKIRPSKEDERILRILESNEKVGELIDLVEKLTPEQQERLLYYARLEADHIGRKSDK